MQLFIVKNYTLLHNLAKKTPSLKLNLLQDCFKSLRMELPEWQRLELARKLTDAFSYIHKRKARQGQGSRWGKELRSLAEAVRKHKRTRAKTPKRRLGRKKSKTPRTEEKEAEAEDMDMLEVPDSQEEGAQETKEKKNEEKEKKQEGRQPKPRKGKKENKKQEPKPSIWQKFGLPQPAASSSAAHQDDVVSVSSSESLIHRYFDDLRATAALEAEKARRERTGEWPREEDEEKGEGEGGQEEDAEEEWPQEFDETDTEEDSGL